MASQDDYFQMLGKKSLAETRTDDTRAALLLKELQRKDPWPDDYRSATALEDALVEDAASMNKLDELKQIGSLGFIQKYGLGAKAKYYMQVKAKDLEGLEAEDLVGRFEQDLMKP